MGMSASQARLIALTARMSDTEYEAQQINQQRVTLSNQMNAVYEAMMDMDVPTPPSKLDPQFLDTVYRAKLGSDTITIRPNGAGKMAAYKTVKNGNIVSDAGGQNVGKVADLTSFLEDTNYQAEDFKFWDPAKLTSVDTEDTETDDSTVPENNNEVQYYTSSDFSGPKTMAEIEAHNSTAAELKKNDYVVEQNGSYVIKTAEEIAKGVSGNIYICTNKAQFEISQKAIQNGLKEGDVTVGGCQLISMERARGLYANDETFENALSSLKHSFPKDSDEKLNTKFQCIIGHDSENNLTFSFCMSNDIDLSNPVDVVSVYEVGLGSYEEEISDINDFDPKNIKYDTNGNVREAVVKGETLSFSTETALDEEAYEDAMNQYKSDKNVYDHEQNSLNKQTSIYQRQDKMLELKLTRLESERNALKTEIDAVKKVIQDAIDGGFKTFSG